jgi:primosomal protein N' (replication factor Y)
MMTRYAKVIVDVPAKQTDRAFDYIVPPQWAGWVEIGTRVGVPFGPRVVQGFIVALQDQSEVASDKMKPITQVMDIVPPLTEELIALGKWMSDKYMCPAVIALQAMIPGALKAKYERILTAASGIGGDTLLLHEEQQVLDFVTAKGEVTPEKVIEQFPGTESTVKSMIKQGILLELQTVKDRLKPKRVLTVLPPADTALIPELIMKLSANSKRQKDVLLYFQSSPEPIALADLSAALQVNSSTIKSLADKGYLTIEEREMLRDPYAGRTFQPTSAMAFTPEQQSAYDPIREALEQQRFSRFLLHGVTGSGKTEVYLQAIARCLAQGREAIVLVPEISLTPQMVDRFKGRFGEQVAVLHSRLSQGERYDEWRKIQRRQVTVAVGARSAIFAPFTKLGLIIIDEEHESSYKQEESPKYEAKDVAVERARQLGAVVVLGSATPSLESYHEATEEKTGHIESDDRLKLLVMDERVGGRPMPEVRIVDLREELSAGNRSMFSRDLSGAIVQRLERKEQIVLLLNRRGYATFVLCRSCGFTAMCPHCDIALTYHQNIKKLRCHYCGHAENAHTACPSCSSAHIRQFGTGTQRVEEELIKQFAGIRVIRMDVDTTTEKGSHEKWLNQFRDKQADVLLGTQMVAKGLDFPDVTLVGVLAADSVLHLPDFRAVEKTFQLVTQVAGRAGRHQLLGEVIVQTYNPDHYSMKAAATHDYRAFAKTELNHRHLLSYPPYSKLVLVTLSHEKQTLLIRAGDMIATSIMEAWRHYARESGRSLTDLDILGPSPSPIPRLKDRYRYQCMVKYQEDIHISKWIRSAVDAVQEFVVKDKLQVSVDVDPHNMM